MSAMASGSSGSAPRFEKVARGLTADPLGDDVADPVAAPGLVDAERHGPVAEPVGMPIAW